MNLLIIYFLFNKVSQQNVFYNFNIETGSKVAYMTTNS